MQTMDNKNMESVDLQGVNLQGLKFEYVSAIKRLFDIISGAMIKLNKYTLSAVETDADVTVDDEDNPTDLKVRFHLTWVKKDGPSTETIEIPSIEQMMEKVKVRTTELQAANPGYNDQQYFVDVAIEETLLSHRNANERVRLDEKETTGPAPVEMS